jgi:uncharacterized LabA/DUF88 family protein
MPQIALFIDYENIHWTMVREYNLEPEISRFISVLKERAEQIAHVSYVAAYADFDNADFHGLQSEFQRNNVETRHVFSKSFGATRKNAADIEMSLDAQEMATTRSDITGFVLVCGDRDFIPIVKRLQQKGKEVHIIGLRASTSRDLQNFVGSNYTPVEELLGIIPAKPQGQTAAAPTRPQDAVISTDGVCTKLASIEGRLAFVSVSHFLKNVLEGDNFSEKSAAFNLSVEQGLIEVYRIPNPKAPEHPTSCCRLTPSGKAKAISPP